MAASCHRGATLSCRRRALTLRATPSDPTAALAAYTPWTHVHACFLKLNRSK